ncbi:efflux RND transporter periplasmic adaptor subunit [Clostridium sp. CX1]|uniref:efflux RND transporter periplasmic adaptor subunit n=1 Tax=Clostridium sp. CX1 TaxID=2978346 RepID=UPI0021C21ED2|nr:efflux RND transporter periplasmic adaptor subunit [Clostridium sp. CX1]MCT8976774.1 efflux RND transporter periplasmic adaptor subunit [Clostridium sp. CX1]
MEKVLAVIKKRGVKILIIAVIAVGVGTGGYYIYKQYSTSNKVVSTVKFDMSKVQKTNLAVTVQATGTIAGVDQVNLYSTNSGVVEGMNYEEGSTIEKGAVFCTINNDKQGQETETAQNSLSQKKLDLEKLEKQLDDVYIKAPIDGKVKSVFVASGDDIASVKPAYGGMAIITTGENDELEVAIPFPSSGKVKEVHISAGDTIKKGQTMFKLDDSDTINSIKSKKIEIQQAQSDLNYKLQTAADSTIVSPISGIISGLNIKNGDVTPDDKAMVTVIDISKMKVIVPVDELDIDKIQIGQKTKISVQNIKDKTYEGVVEKISQSGKTSDSVTTFDVTVSIDNPERLKIGMNADVTIEVENKENVLAVPLEAITEKNGKKYVMVQDSAGNVNSKTRQPSSSSSKSSQTAKNNTQLSGNKPSTPGKLVEVQTGLKNQTMIEITSGLTENQTVMVQLPESSSSNKTNTQRGGGGMMGGPPMGR